MAENKTVRVGVVGTGMMGNFHLKTYTEMDDARLVGVFDVDKARAEAKAAEYNCKAFTDLEALASEVDALSVVTPSVTHAMVGEKLLQQGIPCLIEKPLATTEADCLALIKTAEEKNAPLLVGHIERYNPAIEALEAELAATKPVIFSIEARRLSAASARITDVDVVLDLMIHDIEVIMHLIPDEIVSVQAEGFKDGHDHASACLKFKNGTYANISTSRITPDRIRTLDVICDKGHYSLDYILQYLSLKKDDFKEFPIAKEAPLTRELKHFLACVRHEEKPKVSGETALNALKIVWKIEDILKSRPSAGI